MTPLPVIGVPVPLKQLDGLDSLLSIVQMPAGIPVATVAIGNARNAGLLAVRILGERRREAARRDGPLPGRLAQTVREKDAKLREQNGAPATALLGRDRLQHVELGRAPRREDSPGDDAREPVMTTR